MSELWEMMFHALHFKPEDGWFGDPMPLFAEGVYHIYYTKLRNRGGLCWGHIMTENLVGYTLCPDPFEEDDKRGPVNTGCVFYKDGTYHAYYAGFEEGIGSNTILHAVSNDGIRFHPLEGECIRNDGIRYQINDAWRDPFVFEDPDTGLFHMVYCARSPKNEPDCYAGVIGHAISRDLYEWEMSEPLRLHGIAYTHECPQIFRNGDEWEMIYYSHETRFRHAKTLEGPWERAKVLSPDHFDFMAAREMYDGKRHLLCGWLPRRDCDGSERIWGGHFPVIRELTFRGNNPETRFIPETEELFPHRKGSMTLVRAKAQTQWTVTNDRAVAHCPGIGSILRFDDVLTDYSLKMKLRLSGAYPTFTVLIGTTCVGDPNGDCLDAGYALRIDCGESVIRLRRHYLWEQCGDIEVIPMEYRSGAEFSVTMIVHDGILEFSAGNGQTMTTRLLRYTPGCVAFSMQDGDCEITDFAVYTE